MSDRTPTGETPDLARRVLDLQHSILELHSEVLDLRKTVSVVQPCLCRSTLSSAMALAKAAGQILSTRWGQAVLASIMAGAAWFLKWLRGG